MAKKTKFKPEDAVTDEMLDQVAAEDDVEIIDPDAQFKDPEVKADGADEIEPDSKEYWAKMFKVKVPFEIQINKKTFYPGVHTVDRGVAEVLSEMVDKKRRADLAVHVGKAHLVERLLDRTLVVKEVEAVDFSKVRR